MNGNPENGRATRVLVVDDEQGIRTFVRAFLERAGYDVAVAEDTDSAREQLASKQYDVVLSDIVLPGSSGVELLKAIREASPEVQVIMMTGAPTLETAAEAVRAGASDYLSKPVGKDAILKAVGRAARVKRLEDERRRLERENDSYRAELEYRNEQLDALVRQKSRELSEAHDRLLIADSTKSDFLRLISHELRTPANGVLGIANLLLEHCSDNDEVRPLRTAFEGARDRMLATLEGALLLARIQTSREEFHASPMPLGEVLSDAYAAASKFARIHGIVIYPPPPCQEQGIGDRALFETAVTSLFETAAVFTVEGEAVVIDHAKTEGGLSLTVRGAGHTLPDDSVSSFFDVYSPTRHSSYAEELGLKPAVAERIISLFGGDVKIRNVEPPGVELLILLPCA